MIADIEASKYRIGSVFVWCASSATERQLCHSAPLPPWTLEQEFNSAYAVQGLLALLENGCKGLKPRESLSLVTR